MFASDLKNLQEAYENLYEKSDLLTDDLIEEIVEELVEECVEFGYDLDESVAAVEAAAILYIDEAKVTYGSNTESPEQRRERAKSKVGEKKAEARKAAVKTAVSKVKSKAAGAAVSGYVAAKAAKSAASSAVSAAKRAPAAVSAAAKQKKAEVKGGIKKMIGGGLRAAAGGLGKIAKKAAGAASRLGEGVEQIDEVLDTPEKATEYGKKALGSMLGAAAGALIAKKMKNPEMNKKYVKTVEKRTKGVEMAKRKAERKVAEEQNEEVEIYDVVLEYLMSEGHADTIAEAEYIMTELDIEMVNQIVETRLDPRGRPASGPMNVYANPKNKPSQAHLDAVKAYDEKQKKKSPEQRKAELDAYKARQANR